MFYLLIGEITLAVVLAVLAIAILAILIAICTCRRHNEARVCRYASEQSAGLLDHEDGISCGRHKRGRGSRCSFSSDRGPTGVSTGGKSVSRHSLGPTGVSVGGKSVSHHSLGLCRSNPAIFQGTPSRTRSIKSFSDPLTGTIGPIMQFSAPIPGSTGPIELSQKTFLQTPGPIVQCMESTESGSRKSLKCCSRGIHRCNTSGHMLSTPINEAKLFSTAVTQAKLIHTERLGVDSSWKLSTAVRPSSLREEWKESGAQEHSLLFPSLEFSSQHLGAATLAGRPGHPDTWHALHRHKQINKKIQK
ncbi:testis-expressed basic protein 1-like isoform X2 [Arvicanthis niloticus]|uniref:testis-expressed basic protein 1-like isoform X2 n=1 Tax=Arvicanthis niloticus TaxID=61156 RepID=UPI00402BD4F2